MEPSTEPKGSKGVASFRPFGSHTVDRDRSGLSRSDAEVLAPLRQALWRGGAMGFAAGFIFGKFGYMFANKYYAHLKLRQRHFNVAIPLGIGAVGMLIGSVTAGRNEVHSLHYVMKRNEPPKKNLSDYQQLVEDAGKHGPGISWEELRTRQR
mmetsp:Transcript_7781/g.8922  ORF Transcript_7781/g.8922 Transcript_7781/m.8922 type:complete len:152 (+) Transcript_7781:379-834(+)